MPIPSATTKKKTEILISLTDFVQYVSKAGAAKLTVVKEMKRRPPYNPTFDYWKDIRDAIEKYHQGLFGDLYQVLIGITDDSKIENYREIISKYLIFLRKKQITWFAPLHRQWENDKLIVRLNPEIGLQINGEKYLIKLYFKETPLNKKQADLILTVMSTKLRTEGEYNLALLDIRSHRLFTDRKLDSEKLFPLLIGEAKSFETIWNQL